MTARRSADPGPPAAGAPAASAGALTAAVVDAHGMGAFLPAALARHGVACVHVCSDTPDLQMAGRAAGDFTVEVRHHGDVAATARALRMHGVGFVIAGTESGVLLADRLSAELGTAGNGMSRPAARRDKYEMTQAVREAGLATAASIATSSAQELARWARDHDSWPVVLKPRASAGTDNVRFCHSEQDLKEAFEAVTACTDRYGGDNTTVLAQEYLHGDEYFVNTVSRDGAHHLVEVWRYHKSPVDGARPMYDFEEPVPPEDPAVATVVPYVLSVLDALEIRNGAAHTEVILTARGPVLVEAAARVGGSHAPAVVSRFLGTDQLDCMARAIARPEDLAERRLPRYRPSSRLRYVTLVNPYDAAVLSAEHLAEVRSLDSFVDLVLTLPQDAPLPRTVDLFTSPGYLYLAAADTARVEADYRRLRDLEKNGLYAASPCARPA
ncbi:ATP-grasp domain-containing protein [Streptomyces variegatus]|jgi:biotin carboxylase|uniref:ATP-grasp domain-containing protein n=1 Tax=Streptomyces variegatus TaxID=284040 RepID=UPI003C30B0DA